MHYTYFPLHWQSSYSIHCLEPSYIGPWLYHIWEHKHIEAAWSLNRKRWNETKRAAQNVPGTSASESAANPHLSLFLGSPCSSAQRTKPHADHCLCSKERLLSFWLLGQTSVQTVRSCLLPLFLQQFQQSIVTSLFFCPKLSFYIPPHC